MYLAHDLKTPLASSISCLNLLRDEKQLSGELREKYLAIALAKSERLEDLINEFGDGDNGGIDQAGGGQGVELHDSSRGRTGV